MRVRPIPAIGRQRKCSRTAGLKLRGRWHAGPEGSPTRHLVGNVSEEDDNGKNTINKKGEECIAAGLRSHEPQGKATHTCGIGDRFTWADDEDFNIGDCEACKMIHENFEIAYRNKARYAGGVDSMELQSENPDEECDDYVQEESDRTPVCECEKADVLRAFCGEGHSFGFDGCDWGRSGTFCFDKLDCQESNNVGEYRCQWTGAFDRRDRARRPGIAMSGSSISQELNVPGVPAAQHTRINMSSDVVAMSVSRQCEGGALAGRPPVSSYLSSHMCACTDAFSCFRDACMCVHCYAPTHIHRRIRAPLGCHGGSSAL